MNRSKSSQLTTQFFGNAVVLNALSHTSSIFPRSDIPLIFINKKQREWETVLFSGSDSMATFKYEYFLSTRCTSMSESHDTCDLNPASKLHPQLVHKEE